MKFSLLAAERYTRMKLLSSVVGVSLLLTSVTVLGRSTEAADICWTPSQLEHRAGEERVVRGVLRAVVSPPAISLGPIRKSPYSWRGALRRVALPAGVKLIALTFDLCEQPHEVAGYQGDLVDYLRAQGIKATFFAGGKWLLTHPERAQQLVADPLFEVGNHTWEHRNLRLLSGSALDDEIWNVQRAYNTIRTDLARKRCLDPTGQRLTRGRVPDHMTLFRFPFGACNRRSLDAVEAAGLRAVQWDVSSSDPSKGETPEKMLHDVVRNVRPGSIVLFHANGRGVYTSKAVPLIVAQLRAQGYKFATVSELLEVPGAKAITSEICYDYKPGDTDKYDALARRLAERHAKIVANLRRRMPRDRLSRNRMLRHTPPPPATKSDAVAERKSLGASVIGRFLGRVRGTAPGAKEALSEAINHLASEARGDVRFIKVLELLEAEDDSEAVRLLLAIANDVAHQTDANAKGGARAFRTLGAFARLIDPSLGRDAYARAVELDPNNIEGLFWNGWLQHETGNLDAAERSYWGLITLNSAKTELTCWSRLRLGDILMERRKFGEAHATYLNAQACIDHLVFHVDFQQRLGGAFERIGQALQDLGKLPQALSAFQAWVETEERLVKTQPGNVNSQKDLLASYLSVADLYILDDDRNAALEVLRKGRLIAENMIKYAPNDFAGRNDLLQFDRRLAKLR